MRACGAQLQLQPERGKQFGDFGKAQLPGTSIFKRVERGATDARLARELSLAEFERFPALGDLAAYGDQRHYMPSILAIFRYFKNFA